MKSKSSFGWVELLLGLVFSALAIYAFLNPDIAVVAFVYVFGIGAIISGIADAVYYYRLDKRTGFAPSSLILSCVLNIIVGIILLFFSNASVWAMGILFPIWLFIHCVSRLMNLDAVRVFGGRAAFWLSLIANILGIIVSILLLFRPLISTLMLGYFFAAALLALGISSIVTAFSGLRGRNG